jgi:hypothetical protein
MKKLFNLDLHASVIQDISYIIKKLYNNEIQITNWSLSGMKHLFTTENINVEIINENTWKNIDENMIKLFVEKYFDFLSGFDGFIVTHTPVFCLLYETFNKPIILINSCRYEQPYSWDYNNDLDKWDILNNKLKKMHDNKQLFVISNNKADYEYLKLGTGIESIHIPSLCLYTNEEYNPQHDVKIIYNNNGVHINSNNNLQYKNNYLGYNYSWKKLYECMAIIHMPYEISTMSIFEQYSANVPLLFPSKDFLKSLIKNGYYFQSRYNKIWNQNCKYISNLEIAFNDETWIDFWIDNADYYDENNMKHIIYFNNLDELYHIIDNNENSNIYYNEISKKMKEHNTIRIKESLNKWKNIIDLALF